MLCDPAEVREFVEHLLVAADVVAVDLAVELVAAHVTPPAARVQRRAHGRRMILAISTRRVLTPRPVGLASGLHGSKCLALKEVVFLFAAVDAAAIREWAHHEAVKGESRHVEVLGPLSPPFQSVPGRMALRKRKRIRSFSLINCYGVGERGLAVELGHPVDGGRRVFQTI